MKQPEKVRLTKLTEENKRLLHKICELKININYSLAQLKEINLKLDNFTDVYNENINRLKEIDNLLFISLQITKNKLK